MELVTADQKTTLGDYRARKHQLVLMSWGPDYFDPHTNADYFVRNTDDSDAATKGKTIAWRNHWDIKELSVKTAAAAKELDAAKRRAMYEDMQKTVAVQAPFAMMFQEAAAVVIRKNVSGFKLGITEDLNFYRTVKKA